MLLERIKEGRLTLTAAEMDLRARLGAKVDWRNYDG